MKSNYANGHFAEFIALNYLRFKGYRLVAKNYITGKGTHAGEIDLIVKKSNTIIFVEVKKRSDLVTAAYAISEIQKARINRAAEVFIARHPQYLTYNVRFDAILTQSLFTIQHLKNAW